VAVFRPLLFTLVVGPKACMGSTRSPPSWSFAAPVLTAGSEGLGQSEVSKAGSPAGFLRPPIGVPRSPNSGHAINHQEHGAFVPKAGASKCVASLAQEQRIGYLCIVLP
jgi:hypothetical protein